MLQPASTPSRKPPPNVAASAITRCATGTAAPGHLVDVHLLFPESTPIGEAHRAATEIETILAQSIQPHAEVQTHLEPMESHDSAHAGDREAKTAQLR